MIVHFLQILRRMWQQQLALPLRCDQMVGVLDHVKDMQSPVNLDQLLAIHLIRAQSVRTPMNVKVWFFENHSPKARQLGSLLPSDGEQQSE